MNSKLFFFILFSALFFSANSSAHPHSWIEMKTRIEGDEKQITGFKMEWVFDAMTSAYMLDGYDLSPEKKAQSLQEIADSVLNNMLVGHYFTYFYNGEEPVRYKTGKNARLIQNRTKLTLTFELPLAKPQPAKGSSLRLLIFEPSYYVDMSWQKKSDISLSPALQNSCSIELKDPNPTSQQINYALSLPMDADADNALGQLFTQTVRLHCQGK
jgi:ABC-type uncharacterized transport system substrate-binding protein